jgi:hypothetical protein
VLEPTIKRVLKESIGRLERKLLVFMQLPIVVNKFPFVRYYMLKADDGQIVFMEKSIILGILYVLLGRVI